MIYEPAVLKFGSSVLRSQDDLTTVISEIESWKAKSEKLIAVVSAFEGVTNRLIQEARRAGIAPGANGYARLVASGELESAFALETALNSRRQNARMMTPREIGFIAKGDASDATPYFADPAAIHEAFGQTDTIIVPGFSAIDPSGNVVLLGRGGSDISAIFLGRILGRRSVRLIKDVDGLYDKDPNLHSDARRFAYVSWAEALNVCGSLIQHKAVEFAKDCGLAIEIAALGSLECTHIGDHIAASFSNRLVESADRADKR